VIGLRRIKHAIVVARHLMDERHFFRVGEGGRQFAARVGIPETPEAELSVKRDEERVPKETVGCVALDDRGCLAAGTSTGGLSNRPDGRTGDSGVLGAGTWSTKDGAASATCTGEDILRVQLCSTAVRLLDKHSHMEAGQLAIDQMDELVDGRGGLIIIDKLGRIGYAKNEESMSWASITANGALRTHCP